LQPPEIIAKKGHFFPSFEGRGKLLGSLQAQVKQGQEKIKQQESDKALLQECLHAYKHPNDDEQQDKGRGFEREHYCENASPLQ